MKTTGETGRVAYKFRLFGWHITISNAPVKFKPGVAPGRTANYDRIMHKRRVIAEGRCERCGRELTQFGRLYHTLPEGDPARHEVENIRYMCNSCYKAIVRHGAPVEIDNGQKEEEK